MLGGLNGYQYAPNPISWIDPLGLAKKKPPAPEVQHQPSCDCKTGFAYRVLRDDEDISKGISAKDPSADHYKPEGHVLHASKPNVKTQYISASRTYEQAVENSKTYGKGTERIISIDLSKVPKAIDLNSGCSPLKEATAKNRAKKSGEFLIVGHIPANAIKIVREGN